MPTPSSQGASVTWDGVPLGRVTRFRASPGTAVYAETTHVGSQVVGSGSNTRVVKTQDCVGIDPGSVEVGLFGCPPYPAASIGTRATVNVAFEGGNLVQEAYLDSFDVTGQVGEFLVGQAVFRISGA